MYNIAIISLPPDGRDEKYRSGILVEADRLKVPLAFIELEKVTDILDQSTLIVYLGNRSTSNDMNCVHQVKRALELNIPIITAVENLSDRLQQVPKQLEYHKAIEWANGNEIPKDLLPESLEALGIIEKERRVFISYRQLDADYIAIQLHHALTERHFNVFLDRFQTRLTDNVQQRIDEALENIAFVLLLESPDMHNSPWVDWEITRALKSQIPVLILKWITTTTDVPKIKAAHFPTIMFNPDTDLTGRQIVQAKLEEILQAVENNHSEGIFRRRRESINAARLLAESRGWIVTELPRWKLALTRPSGQYRPMIIGITPRLAQGNDLYEVDNCNMPNWPIIGTKCDKFLVQTSTELPYTSKQFLEWTIAGRNLCIGIGINSLQNLL